MINRVLIRTKVIQLVYAFYQNGSKSIESAEKELFFSLSKSYDLYNYLLKLIVDITDYERKTIETRKSRLSIVGVSQNIPTKFIDNRFASQLSENTQLNKFFTDQKKTGIDSPEYLKSVVKKITESEWYDEYMNSGESSYEEDREFWRKIYKNILMKDEYLSELLEDMSLYWNDDKDIIDTFVLKTIKRFSEENGAGQKLLSEFKDEDDKEFAKTLLCNTLKNADEYRTMINSNVKNWDMDRIAFMDVVIMQTALAEILSFPTIPVSVSFNEYIELAKLYSTNQSAAFINGTLDGIVNQLKKDGKLIKK